MKEEEVRGIMEEYGRIKSLRLRFHQNKYKKFSNDVSPLKKKHN